MKKSSGLLILLPLILSIFVVSCARTVQETTGAENASGTADNAISTADNTVVAPADAVNTKPDIDLIREQLDRDYSFTMSMSYVDLGLQGIEQNISQETARDGSFVFETSTHQWWHPSDYDSTSAAIFYYRYEGDDFVCYQQIDGKSTRTAMTEPQVADLRRSYEQMLSGSALLPDYISDFHETTPAGAAGERTFEFTFALEDLRGGATLLTARIDTVASMFGKDLYSVPGMSVRGLLTTDSNLRPLSLSYDLSEVGAYAQTSLVWSEEPMDLISFEYTFDFDLADHIEIPEVFALDASLL
ncbi:MAG: hypothetical protein IJH83_01080 [Coriobacteriales bacterium]|nr:hypothetical protein [Coriobacteriales bacterium]